MDINPIVFIHTYNSYICIIIVERKRNPDFVGTEKNKNMKSFIILLLLLSGLSAIAQNREVAFTQDDRDRLIRLEVKYEMLEKRFDDMDKRIDELKIDIRTQIADIKTFLYWGFGILFSMMMFLFGFVL